MFIFCYFLKLNYRYIFLFPILKINNSGLKNAVNNYAITACLGLVQAENENATRSTRNVMWWNIL